MLKPSPCGDYHNFKRFVHESTEEGKKVFAKPRTVFWETFFFGRNSPFKDIFSNTNIAMNLQLSSSEGPFQNAMVAIKPAQRSVTLNDFYSFGQLLAYCYYFGIQDLHKDNLLLTADGLQVIDVEQAFTELLLPNQTLLLPPNKDITWSAGLNVLTGTLFDQLGAIEAKAILDGFVELTAVFSRELASIRETILEAETNIIRQPVRVFFRATRDYVEHLDDKAKIKDCFSEESIQLDRGDVPYFFMFIGNEKVFYYSTIDWKAQEANVPQAFRKFVDDCAKDPIQLFTKPTFELQWGRGMLYLVKNLKSLGDEDLKWENCKISKQSGQIEFNSPNLKLSAKV